MLKRNGTCWIPGRVRQVQGSVYVPFGMLSQEAAMYFSQKEMLIFCVVPANNDFRNCEANDFRNCEPQHGKQRRGWLEV